MTDSNTRPGCDLATGLDAFREALKPQEGQFMRGATYIINDPKDLSGKPARREDSARIAHTLMGRNERGHFTGYVVPVKPHRTDDVTAPVTPEKE